ncbi:hypothetical protein R1sor_005865 [Riccia sorocarpa]|uniref:Reverse transcriptase zinc-binding domain-containing protein n=1 Tax=Riccia sorocarpa TaxID=122646 RepID=A0ABD3HP71_9MARC
MLIKRYWERDKIQNRILIPLLKKIGVQVLLHLNGPAGRWKDCLTELGQKRIILTQEQRSEVRKFQHWIQHVKLGVGELQNSPSWRWGTEIKWSGWARETKFWSRLIAAKTETEDLSDKWPDGGASLNWKQRWNLLWGKGGSLRTKVWVWRTLHRCFFTGERAGKMGVTDDLCQRCGRESETINHMFWRFVHSMACDEGVQLPGTAAEKVESDFIEELQRLKEFDAEKINTLPKIQVRGTAARPSRQRMHLGLQKPPAAPRKRDVVAAAYGICPRPPSSSNQFGDDKTNLPSPDVLKFTRKRFEKVPRFRI